MVHFLHSSLRLASMAEASCRMSHFPFVANLVSTLFVSACMLVVCHIPEYSFRVCRKCKSSLATFLTLPFCVIPSKCMAAAFCCKGGNNRAEC